MNRFSAKAFEIIDVTVQLNEHPPKLFHAAYTCRGPIGVILLLQLKI